MSWKLLFIICVGAGLDFTDSSRSGFVRVVVRPRASDSRQSFHLWYVSGDASQDYFADGMTDLLITDLLQTDSLRGDLPHFGYVQSPQASSEDRARVERRRQSESRHP